MAVTRQRAKIIHGGLLMMNTDRPFYQYGNHRSTSSKVEGIYLLKTLGGNERLQGALGELCTIKAYKGQQSVCIQYGWLLN